MLNIKEKLYIKINEKYFSTFWVIIQALFLLIIGILILNITNRFLTLIITYAISVFFIVIGLSGVFQNIFSNNNKLKVMSVFNSLFNISISILFIYNPKILLSIFPILFTLYIFIDSIIKTVICLIHIENKLENRYILILRTALTYVFLVILVFFPIFRSKVTYIIVGIYFILLAITYFLDGIDLLVPTKNKDKIKRRIRIVLPVFIAAFIPRKVLKEINKMFQVKEKYDKYIIKKQEVIPDIEVLIHIKEGQIESFGHVDIYINNIVISYGPYDYKSNKLKLSVSDGVLLEIDKHNYIQFCNKIENQNIISFGLKITDIQKNMISKKLEKIKEDTYEWKPISNTHNKDYNINTNRLYYETGAKFYKFKKGKFKTFFVFNTNCVKLVDELIGTSGIDLLSVNGLIAPGTYYDYLSREFRRKNSIVVSKEIYLHKTKNSK
ncbi:MAG: hypothetical protein PHD15_04140 [Clostridia bacterium]|nr:hypothetical protein [Clostridia bacterium]MDD4386930.1 hypothetical protein [Clostridia bacterium]